MKNNTPHFESINQLRRYQVINEKHETPKESLRAPFWKPNLNLGI